MCVLSIRVGVFVCMSRCGVYKSMAWGMVIHVCYARYIYDVGDIILVLLYGSGY